MTTSFTGKVALVTGGASGIGEATVRRLAEKGCRVVIADLQDDLGEPLAKELDGRFVRLDVGDSAAWAAMVEGVLADEGALDIIHLNAGVTTGESDLLALSDAQYERILGANVNGVVYGARAAARAMAGRGGGAIVATASVAGLIGFAPDAIYTMTKHAVVGLVRALATPLSAHRITINGICPGLVDTPLVGAEAKTMLESAGMTLMPASQIAQGVVDAISSGRSGELWVCLPNRDAEPFTFGELPGPLVA
jgi:NAD(P)-dependent dehydrogenase (short-subunit alcohol dehydrogenase family)